MDQPEYIAPSLEEEINASIGATEAYRDINEIDDEIKELHQRHELGNSYLTEKEQEGKLQIMPEEITAEEMEIILSFTQSLAEGTGAQYSTVMPTTESYCSPTPALESLKELLDELLNAAGVLLEKLWDRITDYWTMFLIRVNGMMNMARTIRRVAEGKLGTNPPIGKLKLKEGRYFQHLRYKGKFPGNFQTLKQYFGEFKKDGLGVMTEWSKLVIEYGTTSIDKLTQTNREKVFDSLEEQNKLATDLWEKLPLDLHRGRPLMGSVTLKINHDTSIRSPSLSARASELQKIRLLLEPDENPSIGDSIGFVTLRPNEVIELMDMAIDLGENISAFIRSNKLPALEAKTKQFVREARQRMSVEDSEGSAEQIALSRLVDYPTTYTRWVKDPAIEISRLLVEVTRTIEMLCNESIRTM